MPPEAPLEDELFRFGEIAFDVASILGVTTEQGLKRSRRAINRAMIDIAGHDRKWSWLRVKDSFYTVAGTREYSMQAEVRGDIAQMWMEGAHRGKLTRIPTTQFVNAEPDVNTTSGTPMFFDYEGVDSSGCRVISLFPTPASAIQVFLRYTREIQPISDESKDVRAYWGLPASMLNALIQKSAALVVQGVSTERYDILNNAAEMIIADAYAADQSMSNTKYRAPMIGSEDQDMDPRLPPQYDRG